MRGVDALAWRQHLHFPEVLKPYNSGEMGRGWLALIDVDEFFVFGEGVSLRTVTKAAQAPRLRFLSFNVDTAGNDPALPVLSQHSWRWACEDLLKHPDQRWSKRPKSLVKNRVAVLNSTVHKISRGRRGEEADGPSGGTNSPLQDATSRPGPPLFDPRPHRLMERWRQASAHCAKVYLSVR